jgi:2'-5' RNA ligase superfamily
MEVARPSGIIVFVPVAEPVVGSWRARYDPSAAEGMPAHVTVLFPFRPPAALSGTDHQRLREIFGSIPAFACRFAEARLLPGGDVLYLAPDPDEPFRAMIRAVTAAFPEHPPYEGRVPLEAITPHLTVSDGADPETMERIAAAIRPRLPIVQHVDAVHLMTLDGPAWTTHGTYRLGEAA